VKVPEELYKRITSQIFLFSSSNISMYAFTLILYLFPSSLRNICKPHFQNPISNSLKTAPTPNNMSLIVWRGHRVHAGLVSNCYWLCKEVFHVALGRTVPTVVKGL